jgi:hypothetical protein
MTSLSFGDTNVSKLGGMRWLSAAMIGLGLPMIAGLLLFPGLPDGAKVVAFMGLGLLAVASASIYTISVLIPGDVMGVSVVAAAGTVDLVHQGAFASVQRSYAVTSIRDVRLTKAYDRDGYGFEAPELVLDTGRIFALPATLTSTDIATLRNAIGLKAAKR